ncbi:MULTISPECIES: hypothetical protein [unclassified Mesorhizobium]|uniref:hypothetical protein n=1 Tax=unclassified Mesorhizobium TaxID=325217 RepID=UPI001093C812|nr:MULTISPECIES: hypothetical protein [unclassified Mesorhizobium]TGS47523.1 hypothetical protein EN825_00700 [Mesorhizobium sp. M8A.F.Ca.ET.182.01.1.1]TGS84187.1 hypothetical protein EN824_07425 [Mesorhizobium sp. M8A.F.Ca.ET.181.01.1.1]
MDDSNTVEAAVAYQIKEVLAGRVIAEYHAEAPTSFRAVEQATGRVVALHRSGNYILEVTDDISGGDFGLRVRRSAVLNLARCSEGEQRAKFWSSWDQPA